MCLGTGIIPSAEGRRDPALGIYLHTEAPPDKLFYDFACSLSDYCFNREPSYWRYCRYAMARLLCLFLKLLSYNYHICSDSS